MDVKKKKQQILYNELNKQKAADVSPITSLNC